MEACWLLIIAEVAAVAAAVAALSRIFPGAAERLAEILGFGDDPLWR